MVQTRFKQVLFGAYWDIQLHFSFLLTVRPQKIKKKTKKQETKKLILWEITESENEKRSWKSQFEPKSTYLNLVWTMFYYFILIVQKLNFPPCWIFKYPFKSRRKRDQYDKGQIWGSGCQQKLRIKKRIICD